MLGNELLKFRRSRLAVVLLLVPLVSVAIGAGNYAANSEQLSSGWASYVSQVTLFYGMVFMTIGISIIASTAWRLEHRGYNWNQLMMSPHPVGRVFAVKTAAIIVFATVMQLVFIVCGLVGGFILRIPGSPSAGMFFAMLLAVVPGAAVAAWQSLLSMVIRSFTLPVAVALFACIADLGVIFSGARALGFVLAPQMVTSVISMGTTAIADSPDLSFGVVMPYIVASVVLILIAGVVGAIYLRRSDVRA